MPLSKASSWKFFIFVLQSDCVEHRLLAVWWPIAPTIFDGSIYPVRLGLEGEAPHDARATKFSVQ